MAAVDAPDISVFAPDAVTAEVPLGTEPADASRPTEDDPRPLSADPDGQVATEGSVPDTRASDAIAADLAWLTESAAEPFVAAAVEEIDPSSDPTDGDRAEGVAETSSANRSALSVAESLRRVALAVEEGAIAVPASPEPLDDAAALAAVLAAMLRRSR